MSVKPIPDGFHSVSPYILVKDGAKPASLYLYVPDCDATYASAMAAGATSIMEPEDQFYGDRGAGVTDPFGNIWFIGTHIEDVPPDELERRAAAAGQRD